MALYTLRPIRNIYIAIHQGTDTGPMRFSASTGDEDDIWRKPFSYPVCNVAGHIHDDTASTTYPRTLLHDNAALVPASLASPDAPFSSVPAPLHAVESLTDMPPLDNFHPTHQTTIESIRTPVTPPDPTAAGAIQDIVTSGITVPKPAPGTSTCAPPPSSTSPPAAVALQHNPDLLTPSDPLDLPSSASSNPVLDNILPTESHRSIVVTTAPCASLGPTSAPDLRASVEDDGSPTPSSREEKETLNPLSVNRAIHANTMATLDLPPQSPSLSPATDTNVAIGIFSCWVLDITILIIFNVFFSSGVHTVLLHGPIPWGNV
ncbi:hypothetical protein BJY52DRAFT_1420069 [Lactarius psammicola]|nr:hypothetical protein BJY52DRAFT_1420069 [Lactarius psammicola]